MDLSRKIYNSKKIAERKVYIDFLKIIAIYMVLFNHTGINGFVLFTVARTSKLYPLYLFNSIFIKIAVPLFLMTSGALLLNKKETYKDLMKKRFLKYLFILILGSVIAYLYTCLRINPQKISVIQFLELLYTSHVSTAYWYLYMYLAYILILPLLRKMAICMTEKEYKWMFLIYGIVQSLTIIDFILWKGEKVHNPNFSVFITSNYIFYPLMGYYMEHKMKEKQFNLRGGVILSIVSLIAITLCCFMTHYKCVLTDKWTENTCQTFFNTLIFLPTITVYYISKMWFLNHTYNEKIYKLITIVGGTTFGIYLIEQICRKETKFVFIYLQPYIHTLPACLVWILIACIAGGVVVLLFKQIPGVKKFL